jgi:hypothetical protein
LRAPGREKALAVLDCLPPTLMIDEVGTPTVEDIQNMMQSIREVCRALGSRFWRYRAATKAT